MLDGFAGAEVCGELKDSQLLHDLAGGWCHELSERWRFDEWIFEYLTWLHVDEPEQVPLPEAVREARRRFPSSHAKRLQINERENRPRARRCPGGAVRGSRCGADECAADHAGLAALAGLALRRGEPALHTQAPVHGLLPGHQFRAFERPLRLLHRIRRSLKQGPF